MVFSSLSFLLYFMPTLLIFYFIAKKRQTRNLILVIFSLGFYAWGEPVWVSLLIISAVIDYNCGKYIGTHEGISEKKKGVAISLISNLSLLVFFKYGGFLATNVNFIFGTHLAFYEFGLPIGISFYTFQTLSYTLDVYYGRVPHQKKFMDFLLFVSLFHQLVAGPIVRYKDIADEIENRVESISEFSQGVNRFTLGLFKKVFFANIAGELSVTFLENGLGATSVLGAWLGSILFALQIYYDFSGYSDMAIGLGKMFGFHYKENFNYPYISKSVSEFWRRWHISLGSFFRDYVYIPLGGNRSYHLRNTLIVWFLTGLWHGASWNFVIWGLYNGLFIILEKRLFKTPMEKLPNFIKHVYFVVVLLVGWMIFYFTDISSAFGYIGKMFGMGELSLVDATAVTVIRNNIWFLIVAILYSTPMTDWLRNKYRSNDHLDAPRTFIPRIIVNIAMLTISITLIVGQSYNPFLYFRF